MDAHLSKFANGKKIRERKTPENNIKEFMDKELVNSLAKTLILCFTSIFR